MMENNLIMRIQSVKALLSEHDLDAVLVTNLSDIIYLTGLRNPDCALIIARDNNFFITDARYILDAQCLADKYNIVQCERSYMLKAKELLLDKKIRSVGVQDKHLTLNDYLFLTENCASSFIAISDGITAIRAKKSDAEIKEIISAQKITDDAFCYLLDFIKPGITEKEIAFELEMFVRKNGAERLSFDSIVASGPNSAKPHAIPTDRKVQMGDMITIDYGCVVNGYCSDMTRTVAIGKPNDELKKIYDIVLDAHNIAKENLAPGRSAKEIDALARNHITSLGYGRCFGHGLGHGVGIDIHELPVLSYRSNDILQKGNVVTIEPGIYIPGLGGVRIENMCYITDDGYCDITKSDNKFIII